MTKKNADDEKCLTFSVEQTARLLGCSVASLYSQIRQKKVPCLILGKRKLIPKKALFEWMEQAGLKPMPYSSNATLHNLSAAQPLGDRKNLAVPPARAILMSDYQEVSLHNREIIGKCQAEAGGDTDKQILDVLKEIKAKQGQVHYSWAVRRAEEPPKAQEL